MLTGSYMIASGNPRADGPRGGGGVTPATHRARPVPHRRPALPFTRCSRPTAQTGTGYLVRKNVGVRVCKLLARLCRAATAALGLAGMAATAGTETAPPNIVLVLTDDQGWGETGYNGHPTLRTPNIDALAAAGITLTRFYAASPVCSPTRASLLTGRSNDRTGVLDHGYRLRHAETTLPEALAAAGYATGHFGKWHLNGLRGPGVPLLAEDTHGPGAAGFETWVSTSNYYDDHPMLSRQGVFTNLEGDSSEAAMGEAIAFMRAAVARDRPFFAAVWTGAPHLPWTSIYADDPALAHLDEEVRAHHGEILGIDRSVGRLRAFLRDAGIAEDTLVWFQSDNGGLAAGGPAATGGLRGSKGMLYEGGLRVPSAVEWPGRIPAGSRSSVPVGSVDFLPTVSALAGLPAEVYPAPLDGADVSGLLTGGTFDRGAPLYFRYRNGLVALDGDTKLMIPDLSRPDDMALYDLGADPAETRDIAAERPETAQRLQARAMAWSAGVEASLAGADYGPDAVAEMPRPPVWTGPSDLYRPLSEALNVTLPRRVPGLPAVFRRPDVAAVTAMATGAAGLSGLALGWWLLRRRAGRRG